MSNAGLLVIGVGLSMLGYFIGSGIADAGASLRTALEELADAIRGSDD